MVYMASCGSSGCDGLNSADASWFKIAETGLVSGTIGDGVWGNTDVVKTLKYDAVIPAALADGDYLIRHELLALHQSNNPQFYPECAQLTVTGGGGATPEGDYLVKFPGGYSMSDPGVTIDIDSEEAMTNSNYTVSRLFACDKGEVADEPFVCRFLDLVRICCLLLLLEAYIFSAVWTGP